jgi:hypothetical protein
VDLAVEARVRATQAGRAPPAHTVSPQWTVVDRIAAAKIMVGRRLHDDRGCIVHIGAFRGDAGIRDTRISGALRFKGHLTYEPLR